MVLFVVYMERGPEGSEWKTTKTCPTSTDTIFLQNQNHSCIRCRQKWRQNFKNPSFVKGFEIGFSKSVLFCLFQKNPFADLSKSKNCRHFFVEVKTSLRNHIIFLDISLQNQLVSIYL
jgi:hypothetical protein